MALHRLSLTDFDEPAITLIALYSPLASYQLAFKLNQQLNSKFERKTDFQPFGNSFSFEYFNWKDQQKQAIWWLLRNKSLPIQQTSTAPSLFSTNPAVRTLVPEHKKADYFLKLGENENPQSVLTIIKSLPEIPMAYLLDTHKLKSKKHLIIDECQ